MSYVPEGLSPLGYEQLTGLSTVKGLTPPIGTSFALLHAEAQNIRWRDDNTDPTASVGMQLKAAAEQPLVYGAGRLSRIKFIEETASANLNVSYYGVKTA